MVLLILFFMFFLVSLYANALFCASHVLFPL